MAIEEHAVDADRAMAADLGISLTAVVVRRVRAEQGSWWKTAKVLGVSRDTLQRCGSRRGVVRQAVLNALPGTASQVHRKIGMSSPQYCDQLLRRLWLEGELTREVITSTHTFGTYRVNRGSYLYRRK